MKGRNIMAYTPTKLNPTALHLGYTCKNPAAIATGLGYMINSKGSK